jgi:hypothetical protein
MADLVWTELRSSNVQKVAFDSDSNELLIEFKSGSVYGFPSAGEAAYQDLLTNPSPGSYIHRWLKGQPSRRIK